MKTFIALVAALLSVGLTASSHAGLITVNWSAEADTYLADYNGSYLPVGDFIEIGTFASGPVIGSPSLAGFLQFAPGTIGEGGVGDGAFDISSNGSDLGVANDQIYFVMFNAPTPALATEEAILDISDSVASNWRFPAGYDIINSTSFDLQQMVSNAGTPGATLVPGATIVYGARLAYDPAGYTQIQFIPEPSSYALVGTGLIALLGLMRRRRSTP
ncbi:MAG: PEP-CTERM sorting domain-containing protein [Verrucomicrobiia bacterium]|jgi:hypothetical protein